MTDHTTHFDDAQAWRRYCEATKTAVVGDLQGEASIAGRLILTLEAAIEERSREAASTAAERDALKLRVAALEAQVYGIIDTAREMDFRGDWIHQRSTIAKRALSGDTTALRAMLVEAMHAGARAAIDGSLAPGEAEGMVAGYMGGVYKREGV